MPIIDVKCSHCEHTLEDQFEPKAGLPDYGTCAECGEGLMRQMLCAPNFNMNGSAATVTNRSGRTTNGTKWSVASRPRKYDVKTGKYGSEVL